MLIKASLLKIALHYICYISSVRLLGQAPRLPDRRAGQNPGVGHPRCSDRQPAHDDPLRHLLQHRQHAGLHRTPDQGPAADLPQRRPAANNGIRNSAAFHDHGYRCPGGMGSSLPRRHHSVLQMGLALTVQLRPDRATPGSTGEANRLSQNPLSAPLDPPFLSTCHCELFSKPSEEKARQSTHSSQSYQPPGPLVKSPSVPPLPKGDSREFEMRDTLKLPAVFCCTVFCHSRGSGNPEM